MLDGVDCPDSAYQLRYVSSSPAECCALLLMRTCRAERFETSIERLLWVPLKKRSSPSMQRHSSMSISTSHAATSSDGADVDPALEDTRWAGRGTWQRGLSGQRLQL